MDKALQDKIDYSCEVLRTASEMSKTYYHKPLVICYSGGKDSDVLVEMARLCLKPDEFEILNSHTTVDAPETVYYIRQRFKEWRGGGIECNVYLPRFKDGSCKTMWNIIPKHSMPPTRLARYCCDELKEVNTPHQVAAIGVREDESPNRQGRNDFSRGGGSAKTAPYASMSHIREVMREDAELRADNELPTNEVTSFDCTFIEAAKKNEKMIVSPIYRWSETDVWNFIRQNNLPYNPLYDKGYRRVGCVGCPLGGYKAQVKEFANYPKYKKLYIHAFDRMLAHMKEVGLRKEVRWKTGEEVFNWWIKRWQNETQGQMTIDEVFNNAENQ